MGLLEVEGEKEWEEWGGEEVVEEEGGSGGSSG